MAKTRRVNMRVDEELWAAVEDEAAKRPDHNRTAVVEDALALARRMGFPAGAPAAVNGASAVSPKLREGGVKPVPKAARRR